MSMWLEPLFTWPPRAGLKHSCWKNEFTSLQCGAMFGTRGDIQRLVGFAGAGYANRRA
jgi:hypothetical protein